MINFKKLILPVSVLAGTAILYTFIMSNPPEAQRRGPSKASQMSVQVEKLQPQDYPIILESYGTVQPRTQSGLVSQVGGQITFVSDQFREGGFIKQGDVLVVVDDRDYVAEVNIAKAGLLSAQQALLEEQARVDQAETDWKRLGNNKKPSDLVLRKPQLAAAKANVLSAEAQLQKAQLSLERTKITAPYDGRILTKLVDFGQVISGNTKVADIYATDYVEIRLPIKNKDLALMTLPEEFSDDNSSVINAKEILFKSDLVGDQKWLGKAIRTEGAIDESSQQLYIVGQIDEPFAKAAHSANQHSVPIKIGQYVTADIQGKTIPNTIVIPNKAIYQGSYVYVVVDNMLRRTEVTVRWQNDEDAIIENGLKPGDLLVITSLGQVSSGTRVAIVNENGDAQTAPAGEIKPRDKQGRKKPRSEGE
ncbi:efflux RND transporter periplasmic adaptor subunit [Psychrosphaera haliotis]|uniref:efflux RND transporter periplasmic adaptor subunit n=1 Tax=Psychrosphaera haliotis TaxID=555083 RepID=UPI0031D3133E